MTQPLTFLSSLPNRDLQSHSDKSREKELISTQNSVLKSALPDDHRIDDASGAEKQWGKAAQP